MVVLVKLAQLSNENEAKAILYHDFRAFCQGLQLTHALGRGYKNDYCIKHVLLPALTPKLDTEKHSNVVTNLVSTTWLEAAVNNGQQLVVALAKGLYQC